MTDQKLDLFRYMLAAALVGAYIRIHFIFIAKQHEGIFTDCIVGMLAGAVLGVGLYALSVSRMGMWTKRFVSYGGYALSMMGVAYAGYVLFENSIPVMRDNRVANFHLGPLFFLLLAGALTVVIPKRLGISFERISVILFGLAAIYLIFVFAMLSGLILAIVYLAYLCILGRFGVHLINAWLGLENDAGWELLGLTFIYGVLVNYVIWYALGMFGYLTPYVAWPVIGLVIMAGGFFFRKDAAFLFKRPLSRNSNAAAFRYPVSIYFNILLFIVLLLLTALAWRFPGHDDSSRRMYLASLFTFRELGGFEFLPFRGNWPLIFQPLMMEISGLPLFLTGGLTATRIFYAFCFLSAIPYLFVWCEKSQLPRSSIVFFMFIYTLSSFTLNMVFCDKPEVMAFPALISLFVICMLMLKVRRPWYILALGPLCAIIYNTKLILIVGAFVALPAWGLFKSGPRLAEAEKMACRKAAWLSFLIFVAISLINPVQNILLRGNPLHPFASHVFKSSLNYKDEMTYPKAPRLFFKKSIPVKTPSELSGINLDAEKGLYRPLIQAMPPNYQKVFYWFTWNSINIVTVLAFVLMPVMLLVVRSGMLLFCGFTAFMCFLIWFGWIGDGVRYCAYFPAIVLFTVILLNRQIWPHAWMNLSWRHAIYILLICTLPLSVYAGVRKFIPRELQRYPFKGHDVSSFLEPYSHPVRDYLIAFKDQKPILLVSDVKVTQYGFFHPNFTFQTRLKVWRMNMWSLSALKPTHFLTTLPLDKCPLISFYPKLKPYLKHVKDFDDGVQSLQLYRFRADTPWKRLLKPVRKKEPYTPALIDDLKRFRARYMQAD